MIKQDIFDILLSWDDLLGSVHTSLEKFENAAVFLRLGLPSTVIRHEKGAFRKRSSHRRNVKTPAFGFSFGRRTL